MALVEVRYQLVATGTAGSLTIGVDVAQGVAP